jgi:uncharacterized membrane protein YoaK (UPF0700 family)
MRSILICFLLLSLTTGFASPISSIDSFNTHIPATNKDVPDHSENLSSSLPVQSQVQEPSLRSVLLNQRKATFTVLLAMLSGLSDTLCFRKYGFFSNMVTGNTVRLGFSLAEKRFADAIYFGSVNVCYLAGGVLYHCIDLVTDKNSKEEEKPSRWVAPAALAIFVLRDVTMLVIPAGKWSMPLLTVGFGLVNAASLNVLGYITMAVTGHVTKVGTGIVDYTQSRSFGTSPTTSAIVVSSFITSIVLSAWVHDWVVNTQPHILSKIPPIGTTFGILYALLFGWYLSPPRRNSVGVIL